MKIHSFVGVPPVEWTVEHVCDWLRAIGTKTAVQSFEENKVFSFLSLFFVVFSQKKMVLDFRSEPS